MSKYSKNVSVAGDWVKASELSPSGSRAKIVSEAAPMQSGTFTNKDGSPKTQDVCKVRFEQFPEAKNVSLNRATINALIDAFGEDSKDWMNKYLSVETEKMRVAGKAVTALYLIPEGYERVDDENGYAAIIKKGLMDETAQPSPKDDGIPTINLDDEEINIDDVPF